MNIVTSIFNASNQLFCSLETFITSTNFNWIIYETETSIKTPFVLYCRVPKDLTSEVLKLLVLLTCVYNMWHYNFHVHSCHNDTSVTIIKSKYFAIGMLLFFTFIKYYPDKSLMLLKKSIITENVRALHRIILVLPPHNTSTWLPYWYCLW